LSLVIGKNLAKGMVFRQVRFNDFAPINAVNFVFDNAPDSPLLVFRQSTNFTLFWRLKKKIILELRSIVAGKPILSTYPNPPLPVG
jgi:hypothetical protein